MTRRHHRKTSRIDLLVLLLLEAGLLLFFPPSLLLSPTTITGGDTASHFPTLGAIARLLADFPTSLVFWNHGHFAGFPMFLNYFPLPFALMALVSLAAPLEIAFKVGTLLAVLPLPVAVYGCLRHLGFQRSPAPILGSVFSIAFLCMTENSMWGGNLASTLAGEIAFAMGFIAAITLTGKVYRDIHLRPKQERSSSLVHNALLEAGVALCNGYPLLQFGGGTGFFLLSQGRRAWSYWLGLHTLAFGLAAFFLVPLLARMSWTTPFHHAWHFQGMGEILPPVLWPALAGIPLGWLGRRAVLRRKRSSQRAYPDDSKAEAYLWWQVGVALLGFGAGPFWGLVDIRFLPFAQIYLLLLGAVGWTRFVRLLPRGRLWLAAAAAGSLLAVVPHTTQLSAWIRWNYSGFEAKPLWPAYSAVQQFLRGDANAPRVFYEHNEINNEAGTPRAFELLPHFSGRSTLEGLYMQSSISSPFVFNLQSELSQTPSCPFQDYTPSRLDAERAAEHLKLFNVSHVITVTRPVMDLLDRSPAYLPEVSLPPYRIYRLADAPSSYVVPLRFKPYRIPLQVWRETQFDWFRLSSLDVPLLVVPSSPPDSWTFWKQLLPFSGDFETIHRELFGDKGEEGSISREPMRAEEELTVEAAARLDDNRLEITTSHPGHPLWIKVSYHPDWRIAEGEGELYLASPAFMILVPRTSRTVLRFSPSGGPYALGLLLTGVAAALCLYLMTVPPSKGQLLHRAVHTLWFFKSFGSLGSFFPWSLLILAATGFILMRDRHDPILLFHKASKTLASAQAIAPTGLPDRATLAKAEALFQECVNRFPRSTVLDQAVLGLAFCHMEQGNTHKAESVLRSHLKAHPDTRIRPEIIYHLGLWAEKDNRHAEALIHWWALLLDHPENPYAMQAAALLVRAGEAENVFRNASELFENTDFARAHPLLQALSQHHESPLSDESTLLLGYTLYRRSLWSEAASALGLWIDRHPGNPRTPETLVTLGHCLINLNRLDAAQMSLQRALALDPALARGPSFQTLIDAAKGFPAGTPAQEISSGPLPSSSSEMTPP